MHVYFQRTLENSAQKEISNHGFGSGKPCFFEKLDSVISGALLSHAGTLHRHNGLEFLPLLQERLYIPRSFSLEQTLLLFTDQLSSQAGLFIVRLMGVPLQSPWPKSLK